VKVVDIFNTNRPIQLRVFLNELQILFYFKYNVQSCAAANSMYCRQKHHSRSHTIFWL